jgi:hypothetical protein
LNNNQKSVHYHQAKDEAHQRFPVEVPQLAKKSIHAESDEEKWQRENHSWNSKFDKLQEIFTQFSYDSPTL